MKEEEIIKRLKNIIEINKSFLNCDIQKGNNIYKDIQGLLNLYEKEKEKNKELLEERKSYAEEYIHNNPWLYKQLNELYVFKTDVEKDYISKDKIREIIKELDERVTKEEKTNRFVRLTIGEALSFKHFLKQEILKEE